MAKANHNNTRLYQDIDRVAVSRQQIAARIRRLAGEIAYTYADGDLSILAVLTGSMIFLADLMRQLPLKMRLELASVSSYAGTATRAGKLQVIRQVPKSLAGKHVLIVDDILDSGQTLTRLLKDVRALRPEPLSVRVCVLLRKDRPDVVSRLRADFVGFDVQDVFLVGYGLDYDNLYRNLPDICVLKEHAHQAATVAPKPVSRKYSGGRK